MKFSNKSIVALMIFSMKAFHTTASEDSAVPLIIKAQSTSRLLSTPVEFPDDGSTLTLSEATITTCDSVNDVVPASVDWQGGWIPLSGNPQYSDGVIRVPHNEENKNRFLAFVTTNGICKMVLFQIENKNNMCSYKPLVARYQSAVCDADAVYCQFLEGDACADINCVPLVGDNTSDGYGIEKLEYYYKTGTIVDAVECTVASCWTTSCISGLGLLEPQLSNEPSNIPSDIPSDQPSSAPSSMPSDIPSDSPSDQPSSVPSSMPSDIPSDSPSDQPSSTPSSMPSDIPSDSPSDQPSSVPSSMPSDIPSDSPSDIPSDIPSIQPSSVPSSSPSKRPTFSPVSPCANQKCNNAGKCKVTSTTGFQCVCETTFINSANGRTCICPPGFIRKSDNRCYDPTTPSPVPLTNAPTESPVIKTFVSSSPSKAPADDCNDDEEAEFYLINDHSKSRKCSWLTKNKKRASKRIANHCGLNRVKTICKSTCSFCECADDESFSFKMIKLNKNKKCNWIAKNERRKATRIAKYCTADFDGGALMNACTNSCGICK